MGALPPKRQIVWRFTVQKSAVTAFPRRCLSLETCGNLPQVPGMSTSIRLSDELIAAAKRQAVLFHRSPPQQIEHWAAIGRVMEAALSYPAQERITHWGSARDMDELRATVESGAGRERAREVIRRTSGTIVSNDRDQAATQAQLPV
jgi:hypothetical protein